MAKSYKEKYQESYWRWMRNTDPEATELAMKWAAEHAEEMDQLDRMLFNNNQNFSRRTGSLTNLPRKIGFSVCRISLWLCASSLRYH